MFAQIASNAKNTPQKPLILTVLIKSLQYSKTNRNIIYSAGMNLMFFVTFETHGATNGKTTIVLCQASP